MSNFKYCPLTWHFCGEVNTKKIEKIQERALRFICSDYSSSYEPLLILSQLQSLKVRRMRAIALESIKIFNNMSPAAAYLNDLLTFKNHSYNFRYQKTVEVPQVRTVKHGSRSFRSVAAKIWNSLPQHLRDLSSFGVFKNQINAWSGCHVHVHSVLLVEMFYLLVSLFSCKICMLFFLIFQRRHMLWVLKRTI